MPQSKRLKTASILAENALEEIRQLKDQLEAERAYLQEEIKLEFNHENIIGQSDEIKYVFYKVEQIAPRIPMSWFWVKPEPARNWWRGPFMA